MFRFLIILAIVPIILGLGARWWFGIRILSSSAKRQCRCDLEKWNKAFGDKNLPVEKENNATFYARLLRKAALEDWKTSNPKAAASREGARRFGMAVPPLAAMVAILGMIVGRIPFTGVLAIFLTAIAFSVIVTFLSIAPELKAILTTSRRLRATGVFYRRDDEDAVIEATTALAWKESAPPVFNLIQR